MSMNLDPVTMSLAPQRLTATSIAVLPDGSVAQAVIDISKQAYARWYSDGSWSPWWAVASSAADVSVAGANVESSDVVYVSVAIVEYADVVGAPLIYALSASGVSGTSLLPASGDQGDSAPLAHPR